MPVAVQNATTTTTGSWAKTIPTKSDSMMMVAAPNVQTTGACPTPGTAVIPAASPPPGACPPNPAACGGGKADKMDTTTTGGTGSATITPKVGAKRNRMVSSSTSKTLPPAVAVIPVDCPSAHAEPGGEERGPESGTWLIVAKAVRMHLKNHEVSMHCGSDALPALNAKLADLIKDAIGRAQTNGRKTLKACDF